MTSLYRRIALCGFVLLMGPTGCPSHAHGQSNTLNATSAHVFQAYIGQISAGATRANLLKV